MIERVEPERNGTAIYQLRVNREIKAVFSHRPADGLPECLRIAAQMIELTSSAATQEGTP